MAESLSVQRVAPNPVAENNLEKIDKGSVFRLWYDLAKELGYCTAQEIRDGEHWIRLSGNWEKWHDAVKWGYSVEYLKGVMKRNQNR